jgi:Tol biopolymer transport system component
MSARRRPSGRVLLALIASLAAACSPDRPTDPEAGPPPLTEGLAARAVAVRVDVDAGTVTVLDRSSASAKAVRGATASFALLGANEIAATTSNFFRSAVGQFIAKKVRVRFDIAITNRSSVALLPPTFPVPPAGTTSVLLFPFATTLTGGNGAIDASTDWDGAALNFFNDASCSSGTKSDCYRWEPYPAPFAAGSTTGARTVGFDVDPTVTSFTTYVVLAADLPVPGAIAGTVSSPEQGPLGHVTVSLAPANRFTGTSNTGGYGFDNVSPGTYTVSLSGLPGYCFPAAAKPATVVSGATTTVNFSVQCPRIAFVSRRTGGNEIWTMNNDGTGQRQVTSLSGSVEPAWSPDGSRIAFFGPSLPNLGDIFTIQPDGTGLTQLTHTGMDYEPGWAPDGSRMVFTSSRDDNNSSLGGEIYVMNADGTGQTRISNDNFEDLDGDWSPDGSKIAYARWDADASDERINMQIFVMNPDGSGQTPLTELSSSNSGPDWSPDGSRIAFSSDRSGAREIWVMNANGSNPVRLTTSPTGGFSSQPAWSPDGSRIAFSQASGPPVQGFFPVDVWVMNADGSNPVRLTSDERSGTPAWEP